MKKLILFALPLLALTLGSCSKNSGGNDNNGNGSGKLVKTISEDGSETHFFYDEQRRLSHIGDLNENYVYKDHFITHNWKNDSPHGSSSGFAKYTLDNNGYVTKTESKMDSEAWSGNYEYRNGYISKSIWNDGSVALYTWDNGNMTEAESTKRKETYTYIDKENKLNLNIFEVLTLDFPWYEEYQKFKGSSPQNLPASMTTIRDEEQGGKIETTFSYTLDSDGYPTEIIRVTKPSDGSINRTVITIKYY